MTQEEQDKILRKLNAGVIGKRKQGDWDRASKMITITKKDCIKSAKKYNSIPEWRDGDVNMYNYAHKSSWFDEITTHFKENDYFWTKEEIKKVADKYTSYTKFKKEHFKAFRAAQYSGWMDLFDHMNTRFEYNWTPEKVLDKVNDAIKNGVPNITQFIKQNQSVWRRGVKPLNMEEQVRNMFKK